MLRFIIDGYNLVHQISRIKKSANPCHQLLFYIYKNKLTGSKNNRVLVVFDGRQPPYDIGDFGYKILFSQGQSADSLILSEAKKVKNKKEVLVVSDDRDLGYKAKMLGAGAWRIEKFIKKEKKIQKAGNNGGKEIRYSDQREITEELRRIWLDKKNRS